MERAAAVLTAPRPPRRWLVAATGAVLAHPSLWPTALGQLVILAAPGWWRQWPPVPAPDPAYLRFRLQTMYGDPEHEPDAADVVTYLKWCRSLRRGTR